MTSLDPIAMPQARYSQSSQTEVQQNLFTANRITFAMLWLIPPFFIAWLIWRYAVDMPVWDDISMGATVQTPLRNGFTYSQLFAQHNEARPAFLRLIFRLLFVQTQWDVRYQMYVSFGVILCTSLIMIRICLRTIQNRTTAWITVLFINYMLFSPVQWQCFLWGMELIVFISTLPLVIMIVCLGADVPLSIAMPIAAIAAVTATFSSSNGMLLWLLAVPFFLAHSSKLRLRALVGWAVLSAITLVIYFRHYEKPPGHPPYMSSVHQPVLAINFLLAFIGNAVRIDHIFDVASSLGAGAVGAWGVGVLYIAIFGRKIHLWRRSLPWITLGTYTILSGVLTTVGRFGFGPMAAITARYTPFAIPLWLSIVPMWIIIFDFHIRPNSTWKKITNGVSVVAGIAIVGLMLKGCIFVRSELLDWNAQVLAARAVGQFALAVPDDDAIATTYFPLDGAEFARNTVLNADRLGLFHPQCFRSNDIAGVASDFKDPVLVNGYFDQPVVDGENITLNGWACLPIQRVPANAVLLTTPDKKGVERIFAIAGDAHRIRYDVAKAMSCQALDRSGWTKTISINRLPHGAIISGWAYDTCRRRAYKLEGSQTFP